MPKRTQYESDNGFVEDAPESKKRRSGGNELEKAEGKALVSTEMHKDDDGNEYWEISKMRRIGVSTFKGATMVNIREYYEKDGKSLPGKKGISLSIDQFTQLLDVLPQIESVLKAKGVKVPRPKYDKAATAADDDDEEEVEAGAEGEAREDDDEEQDEKPAKGKLDKYKMKGNHEATSDEDDG